MDYASANGMRVKGHTFIWHCATPSWVNALSSADFRAAMDVRINNVPGTDQARLDIQRVTYRDVVGVCVMEPRCEAITFWGFTDAHTWISGDRPLLFDVQYMPKPAYYGVLDALRGR